MDLILQTTLNYQLLLKKIGFLQNWPELATKCAGGASNLIEWEGACRWWLSPLETQKNVFLLI